MNKKLIAVVIAASLSVSQLSQAANSSVELDNQRSGSSEVLGFGSGAAVGAVVGGPVGALVGAFAGLLLGKTVADEQDLSSQRDALALQREQLNAQDLKIVKLTERSEQFDSLAAQHVRVNSQLEQLKIAHQQKLNDLALGLNVHFKTGSSEIESQFQQQLDDVVYTMTLAPELKLNLTGYADRQGDTTYNQALSEQRLSEVKTYLMNNGIAEARLYGEAYGASSPLSKQASLENNFFDRRVTLKLKADQGSLAAQ